jgi:ABC-type multidrug transport system fused ATPase/permease subunit
VALFLFLQFAYQFVNRILNRVQNMVNSLASELVTNHIRMKLMNKAKTVDLASFDRPDFYERLENANREAGTRPLMILSATFSVLSALISGVSFVVVLCSIGWQVPLIVLALAAPTAIVNHIFRNRHFWYIRHRSKERRQMNYYSSVVTDKDLAKEMRLMDLSDTFIEKYQGTFRRYFAGLKRLILREGFWQVLAALVSLVAEGALFFYIAYRVVSGNMGIGDYSLFAGALTSIGTYVSTAISSGATIYEGTLFIDNVMIFMQEKRTVLPTLAQPRTPLRHVPHTLTLDHVSFRYPGTERDVIRDVSVTLKTGDRIVLVGLNGAGKTTLIKLLTRLYDPTEGQIMLDGHDIREYDTAELYRLYGTIFQDFGKYALTVEENIALGDVHTPPDPARIREAAKQGNADVFIDKLPGNYQTPLMRFFEYDATELSGGQWQKLSIARAFYADSDILILDEPTASLDAMAEQEVFDQFASLGKNKLTILVSHRLSGAVNATRILVLGEGRLLESGSHEELMQKKGAYYTLFTTQAKHYIGAEAPHMPPPPGAPQPSSERAGAFDPTL